MNWYIKLTHEQSGPYSKLGLSDLYRSGKFTRDTLVWVYQKDGWDWVKAESVIELREVFLSETKESPLGLLDTKSKTMLDDKIWAVAGGKGGTGKSVIASSLAIGLTVLGKRVILVDLDLGGPNLHTLFGREEPSKTIFDFLEGKAFLQDTVVKTDIERLSLISGKSGTLGAANIPHLSKKKLLSNLKNLDCDYLILDIGAGSSYNQLDFFIEADQGIIVTMPEPHAIQDAFHFLKTALLRKIYQEFKDSATISNYFKDQKYVDVEKIESFLKDIALQDPEVANLIKQEISRFCPRVILNQVMDNKELKDGHFFIQSLKEMLLVDADFLGYVWFDRDVRRATQNLKPFLINTPKSKAATCIFSMIVHKLLNHQYVTAKFKEMGLRKKVKGLDYETIYPGYRSSIGIYK